MPAATLRRLVAHLGAGGHRGQGVGDVEVSGQGYAGRNRLPARADDGEPRAGRRRLDVDCPPVGLPPGGGEGAKRDRRLLEEPAAVGVVDVDQAESCPFGGEQGRLGREVVVHVGVEVEVVATEVGEHGDVEHHPVDPAHHQRVARHLHRASLHSAFAHHREQRVQVGGLRRGERRLHVGAGDSGADGADRGRGHARLLQTALGEPGRRRLALGAGHADHPERRCRVAVHAGREAAEDRARVVDHEERDLRCPGGAVRVGEDRDRAGVQRWGGVVDAVGAGSGQRGVDVARTDPLRAERDPGGLAREVPVAAEPIGPVRKPRREVREGRGYGVPGSGRLDGVVAQHPARLPLAEITTRPGGSTAGSRWAAPGSDAGRSS